MLLKLDIQILQLPFYLPSLSDIICDYSIPDLIFKLGIP